MQNLALKKAKRVKNEQQKLLQVDSRTQAYNRRQNERRLQESERLRQEEAAATDLVGSVRDLPHLRLPRYASALSDYKLLLNT